MTVLEAPALYDATLQGEPLQRTVRAEPLNTDQVFWTVGEWPIGLPAIAPGTVIHLQRAIRETRDRTGWSARRLAEIVGTTHTTILNAENGRPLMSGHSGALRQRLIETHDLIERVYVLLGRDPGKTAMILATSPGSRRSAVEELKATGDPGRAYIAVLDALRPQRTGLLVADRPREDRVTTALHE